MKDLINETTIWSSKDSRLKALDQGDQDKIRELLLGHTVETVAGDHMFLNNGTVVKLVPNDGGCSCSAGDYKIAELNDVDNIITRVDFRQGRLEEDDEYSDAIYEVYVVAAGKEINLFTVVGNDGNGYYGTGYELLIRVEE